MDALREGAKEAVPPPNPHPHPHPRQNTGQEVLGGRHVGAWRIFRGDFLATSPPEGQFGV